MALRPPGRSRSSNASKTSRSPRASSTPTAPQKKPDQGEVVAVGPGKKTEEGKILPADLKAGDKVLLASMPASPQG